MISKLFCNTICIISDETDCSVEVDETDFKNRLDQNIYLQHTSPTCLTFLLDRMGQLTSVRSHMNFCWDIMTHRPDKIGTFESFLGQILVFNKNASKGNLLLGLLLILQEPSKKAYVRNMVTRILTTVTRKEILSK